MAAQLRLQFLCLALLANHLVAQERPRVMTPVQRQLESLVLPKLQFREADLVGALQYLSQKAAQQSGQKVRLAFSFALPEDFAPRHELTLELNSVPASEALRYVGEQAGVEFDFTGETIVVQPAGTAAARAVAPPKKEPVAPPMVAPKAGPRGPLAKPAAPAYQGDNVHHALSGDVQVEKSGRIPQRSLSGWPVQLDPKQKFGLNCLSHALCKVDDCGCKPCACQKEPSTRR